MRFGAEIGVQDPAMKKTSEEINFGAQELEIGEIMGRIKGLPPRDVWHIKQGPDHRNPQTDTSYISIFTQDYDFI
jgi:hypothetical protein